MSLSSEFVIAESLVICPRNLSSTPAKTFGGLPTVCHVFHSKIDNEKLPLQHTISRGEKLHYRKSSANSCLQPVITTILVGLNTTYCVIKPRLETTAFRPLSAVFVFKRCCL